MADAEEQRASKQELALARIGRRLFDQFVAPCLARATCEGVHFDLRTWDIRYPAGQERITDASYDEVVD